MEPNWQDLTPILRGAGYSSLEVWGALDGLQEFIARIVHARVPRMHFEDVFQEVFLNLGEQIFRSQGLPVSEGHGDASAWFGTVVRSRVLDWQRRQNAHEQTMSGTDLKTLLDTKQIRRGEELKDTTLDPALFTGGVPSPG